MGDVTEFPIRSDRAAMLELAQGMEAARQALSAMLEVIDNHDRTIAELRARLERLESPGGSFCQD